MRKIQSICKISTICFLGALFLSTPLNAQTKIACVGNSITCCYNYPEALHTMLTNNGISNTVQNEGVSTTTMLKPAYSNCSYWTNGKLAQMFQFKPDVITIMLGTNDAKQGTLTGTGCNSPACINNWKNKAQFTPAYNSMIDTIYSTLGYRPKIFCVFPPPAAPNNVICDAETSFTKEMIPMIQQVAADKGLPTINCHQTSYQSNPGSSDGIHPTAAGVDSLVRWFYRGLTTIRMIPYPAGLSFTVRRGQTDTTGTTRLDSVSNAAITGTLDSITVSNKATWLQCKAAGTPRNSQKVRNTIALTMLPAAAGTYYDTVTLSATNANLATSQYIVTLTLQPSVDVKGDIYASSGLGPDVRLVNSHEILVTTFKPGLHDVFLYTTSGKTAASTKVNGAGTALFHAPAGPSAVYIVRVKSSEAGNIDKVLVNLGK
jgi:lysophospholipase L1-like esterase